MIDIGGGSTEYVQQSAQGVEGVSLDMGCVRFTERFFNGLPPKANEIEETVAQVRSHLNQLKIKRTQSLLAVAGTPTTLAQVDLGLDGFRPEKIEGHVLTLSFLKGFIRRLAKLSVEEIQSIRGMDKKQADIILMGTILLATSMEVLGYESVTVSTRGVRYGVALHRLGLSGK